MFHFNNIDEMFDNIWLGNNSAATDIKDLKKKGIKKILTVMNQDGPNYMPEDGFIHKKYNIIDSNDQNIIQYFGECLKFMEGEEKVLVHCWAGACRSATIVIAYVMWKKKMKYKDASQYVKDKRFIVYPNFGFRKQLQIFEKLLIDNEYDIDKIKFEEIKINN